MVTSSFGRGFSGIILTFKSDEALSNWANALEEKAKINRTNSMKIERFIDIIVPQQAHLTTCLYTLYAAFSRSLFSDATVPPEVFELLGTNFITLLPPGT